MSSEWGIEQTIAELIAEHGGSIKTGPFGTALKASEYSAEGIPLISVREIGHGAFHIDSKTPRVSKKVLDRLPEYLLEEGDIVFARKGGIERCALVRRQQVGWFLGSDGIRLRPPRGCDPRFLAYALQTKVVREWLVQNCTGSTMASLNQATIGRLPVTLPSLRAQQQVAETLESLDDRITLLRETNATLEAIAQALYKSWFVDFDPVHAKQQGRPPEGMDEATAALFSDSFEESELGLVPRGWRIKAIGDAISVVDYVANGSFAALKQNVILQDTPSYALYVRTTDYNSGFTGGYRYVDKAAYDFLSKSSLDGKEVIISNVGDVGTVFRPPRWLGLPMTLGSNAIALKVPELSSFLYFYFSGTKGQHDIKSIITGSAQLKFNKTNFRSLKIAIPEASILNRFEAISGDLLSKIDGNVAHAQTLTNLRDTLLPRLISGQLRLPEAEVKLAVEESMS